MFLPRPSTRRAMALVVALFAVVAFVHAQPCTTTTCPPGPVSATFPSIDCSGSPSFESVTQGGMPIEYGACIITSEFSSMYYYSTDTTFGSVVVNNPTCTMGLANQSSSDNLSIFGVCNPDNANRATMLLSGVNATYTSPQVFTPNPSAYPDFMETRKELQCPLPNNCSIDGYDAQFWTTRNDPTCTTHEMSIGIFNISYDGTCYRMSDYSYQSYNCMNDHTTVLTLWVGNGCQVFYGSITQVQNCNSGEPTDYHCIAAPVNIPMTTPMATPTATPSMESPSEPAPSAAAFSLLPSAIFVFASLVALFF